jgi:Cytotoxic translational repressor of toxin-antitoxin stability system
VRYEILVAPDAGNQLAALSAHTRSEVRGGIELHLRFEPTKVSKSRIKRLRGFDQPQYRLRVGEIRVFYDVTDTEVHVLAIVEKAGAQAWLDEQGTPTPPGSPSEGEG